MLLTVGRLDARERYKGHDRVIRPSRTRWQRGHDIAYIVIGEGDDRARLTEMRGGLGVAEPRAFRRLRMRRRNAR